MTEDSSHQDGVFFRMISTSSFCNARLNQRVVNPMNKGPTKDQAKEKIRQRVRVQIDESNYADFPETKNTDHYDNDIYQRVAVYARVSTDDPRQTTSYELQKKYYQEFVEKHPKWELTHIYADEFIAVLEGASKKMPSPDEGEDESVGATADDIIESTKDFILKELSRQLKGYNLEELVADLLRAMGYRTTLSPHGGDNGIDITAYKDELPPRILVQVKSQDSDITGTTIQSLKGAMREGDYGLFVTLSNYTKKAREYLDSVPIIRGINGTELVDLILKYYESLSEKYQRMIPLKMVYIPVPRK